MQLEVEATGIAHRLAIGIASPQGCGAGVTVGTLSSSTLADDLSERKTDVEVTTLQNNNKKMSFKYHQIDYAEK